MWARCGPSDPFGQGDISTRTSTLADDGKTTIWEFKPWWCQPWTIFGTGVAIIGATYAVTHFVWLTLVVAAGMVFWWFLFLGVYPTVLESEGVLEELKKRRRMQEAGIAMPPMDESYG